MKNGLFARIELSLRGLLFGPQQSHASVGVASVVEDLRKSWRGLLRCARNDRGGGLLRYARMDRGRGLLRYARNDKGRGLALAGMFLLAGCAPVATTEAPTPIVITVLVPLEASATSAPTASLTPLATDTSGAPTPVVTATPGPLCSAQQDLNLRSGPGTAYDPPIGVLKAGTQLTPRGYAARGAPGGAWAQVEVVGTGQVGWVNAAAQYIVCNLEVASLPVVEAPPPPTPKPPKIGVGDVDGNGISNFRSSFDYNPSYFLRLYVFRSDDPDEQFSARKDGRGIHSVEFIITDEAGNTVYQRKENQAGYCIFGGGEPDCNPWTVAGREYRWKAGGEAVKAGNYLLTILATGVDGVDGTWTIKINVER